MATTPQAEDALTRAGVDANWISAVENPQAAQAAVDQALDEASPMPDLEPPGNTLVELPGGLALGNEVIRKVEVQELTGEHEEQLSRATQANNVYFFISTLLECGTLKFDGHEAHETKALLKKCLVGDRDEILLGIREATYGPEVTLHDWICPVCTEKSTLHVPMSDFERKRLVNPQEEQTFEVTLRKGGRVKVRLANGEDQAAVFADPRITGVQRDSITLQRALMEMADAKGEMRPITGASGSLALKLSIPDRHKIIKELMARQPGPKFEVKFKHDACGEEVTLSINMGELFPAD